jgi:molybdate transport system regulatory protein
MKVKFRLWIDDEGGNRIMGEGLESLLRGIENKGSISSAALELSMSYRSAWAKIKKAEERLHCLLVRKYAGGFEGGGSCLTPQGLKLLRAFNTFHIDAEKELNSLFHRHFDSISKELEEAAMTFQQKACETDDKKALKY